MGGALQDAALGERNALLRLAALPVGEHDGVRREVGRTTVRSVARRDGGHDDIEIAARSGHLVANPWRTWGET